MRIFNCFCLTILAGLFFTSNGFCEPDYSYYKAWGSPAEISMLPEYCKARLSAYGKDKRLYNKWKKIIGKDFIHFHHHAYGLILARRVLLETRKNYKEAIIRRAIHNLKYVDKNASARLNMKWRIIVQRDLCEALANFGKYEQAALERKKLERYIAKYKKSH